MFHLVPYRRQLLRGRIHTREQLAMSFKNEHDYPVAGEKWQPEAVLVLKFIASAQVVDFINGTDNAITDISVTSTLVLFPPRLTLVSLDILTLLGVSPCYVCRIVMTVTSS